MSFFTPIFICFVIKTNRNNLLALLDKHLQNKRIQNSEVNVIESHSIETEWHVWYLHHCNVCSLSLFFFFRKKDY